MPGPSFEEGLNASLKEKRTQERDRFQKSPCLENLDETLFGASATAVARVYLGFYASFKPFVAKIGLDCFFDPRLCQLDHRRLDSLSGNVHLLWRVFLLHSHCIKYFKELLISPMKTVGNRATNSRKPIAQSGSLFLKRPCDDILRNVVQTFIGEQYGYQYRTRGTSSSTCLELPFRTTCRRETAEAWQGTQPSLTGPGAA